MAKYCSAECQEHGGMCDFCIHYRDEYKDIKGSFAGEGICSKKNIEVMAHDGCDDDFECFQVEDKSE